MVLLYEYNCSVILIGTNPFSLSVKIVFIFFWTFTLQLRPVFSIDGNM